MWKTEIFVDAIHMDIFTTFFGSNQNVERSNNKGLFSEAHNFRGDGVFHRKQRFLEYLWKYFYYLKNSFFVNHLKLPNFVKLSLI